MNEKIDVLELLKQGKTIQVKPQGFSMYPLFVPGRDEAIIRRVEEQDLRRGQVLLYRGQNGVLTLHRVWKVKEDGVYFVGDNQVEVEGPVSKDVIYGTMCGYIRRGKEYATDDPIYLILFRGWLFLRPIRNVFHTIVSLFRRHHEN